MKIQIITDVVTRRAGGVFDAVRDMFTNKLFRAQDVEILSYEDDMIEADLPSWQGLPIRLFKPHFFLYSKKLKEALMNSTADIYHQQGLWRYSHLLMEMYKKKVGKPIVCTPHGMLDPFIIQKQGKMKRIISDLFFQKSLEAVDCYQALCVKELEDIRAYGLKQPVAIIPNGVNLPDTSKEYKKKDNKRHLLFLGRLHTKKGVDILLQALANIKRTHTELLNDWQVDLVGWDHENCRKHLEKIVELNQMDNIVTFHGGLYGEDKIRMYATCDAYILPSHGEGLPMTVLEAWSWHKPTLITPHCHLPEGYQNNAAIYIEDNIESVEHGLVKLFTMSEKDLQVMGDNAYKLVKNQFTWDAAAKKLILTYEWILGKIEKPDFIFL